MSGRRRSRRAVHVGGAVVAFLVAASCAPDVSDVFSGRSSLAGLGGFGPSASSTISSTISSTSHGASVSSTAISAGALGGTEDPGDAGDPCAPLPLPPGVPEGWVEYLDWSCSCRYYVPGSKNVLPAPVAWEPCPPLPNGITCESMVIDWSASKVALAFGWHGFDRNPDGTAVLGIRRITENPEILIDLVADASGPVRSALMTWRIPGEASADMKCHVISQSLTEGKYLLAAYGTDAAKHTAELGALGGSIDDQKLAVMDRFTNKSQFGVGYEAGAKWIARGNALILSVRSWDDPTWLFVTSPATDPSGLHPLNVRVSGDGVFWRTGSDKLHGINVWDPVNGPRPFIRWVGDYTRGAAEFGTDGVDMVWAYGEGKEPNDTVFPVSSIMTSPFTTDPAKLAPKRLRSYPYNQFGTIDGFVVGCGYAAHKMLGPTGIATLVVRISDGVSWVVPHTPEFVADHALGLTCEEVFIQGQIAGRINIARVRLDSLGPGILPD